ncbi:hypothetical protein Cni_G07785 [Canna indica]|uniref:HMA domain-containing protein n=1 Tax=Canna indica TaxID=4628 RepID=A0AAQ3K0X2_9LILI|nr:hypothetical protein Cni_G07785 [Canna indica]
MAAISAFSSSLRSSISYRGALPRSLCPSPPLISLPPLPSPPLRLSVFVSPSKPFLASWRPVGAVADGEAEQPEEEQSAERDVAGSVMEEAAEEGTTVAIPVMPSDMLTMLFQAEGTMDESAIPAVMMALEGLEGVSDLSVRVAEGIATVELTKQTTVQTAGVASNLVEIIQGTGFKLQSLNLSFEDEEDVVTVS